MYDEERDYHEQEQIKEVDVSLQVTWSDRDIQRQVIEKLVSELRQSHEDALLAELRPELEHQVNDVILGVLEKTIQPTDIWGNAKGEPVVIRELLQRDVEEWLTERVDSYGNKADYFGNNQTRAEYLFKESIGDSLTDRVKKIIVKEVGNLDALIAEEVKKQLRATVKRS